MTKAIVIYLETYQKLDGVHLEQKSPKHPRKCANKATCQY